MAVAPLHHRQSSRGFTLVELVTVILILGVLVLGVSGFIIFGTRLFVESSAIDQVLGQSRFAIERMTRELRGALPNSVRLEGDGLSYQCVEFVPLVSSSRYLSMPIAPSAGANVGEVMFDTPQADIVPGQYAWIYPLAPADVYDSAKKKRAKIHSIKTEGAKLTLTFDGNVSFAQGSPRQRMYFASAPVSYCFEQELTAKGAVLKRYSQYGFASKQLAPKEMGDGVLMASSVDNALIDSADLPIALTPASLVNNALVQLQPRFKVNGETFQYRHQVQVINVP